MAVLSVRLYAVQGVIHVTPPLLLLKRCHSYSSRRKNVYSFSFFYRCGSTAKWVLLEIYNPGFVKCSRPSDGRVQGATNYFKHV